MRLGTQFAIAAIGLALLVMGAWAMRVESDAFVIGGDTSAARVANWTTNPPEPGWSIATENVNLLDCANVLRSPNALTMRYLDDTTRAAMAPTCLALAERITGGAPAASYAWYVGAMALSAMNDIPAMNAWLLRSQVTAPNEQWIAELRVALAEAHYPALLPEVAAAHDDDLRLLVVSSRGIASIARRYAGDPAFRDRIVAIVESLPAASQQTFLNQVRAAVSNPR